MSKVKRKQINVDEEVYQLLAEKAQETGTTLNNAVRSALGLGVVRLDSGRPRTETTQD
jgi:macrodomain Ter protein organizer (MatP/YcbG family)